MRGWLGPGLQATFDTPDILKELGFDYVCEWCIDDTPGLDGYEAGPHRSSAVLLRNQR